MVATRFFLLRCPYTDESGSRVRLGSGSNEPNSSVCGAPRARLGSLLARTCVGGPEPGSRIHRATRTDSVSFVTKEGSMSTYMSKILMSPDFLTKFLEEYRVAGSQRRLF
jgi:hypothetical protein